MPKFYVFKETNTYFAIDEIFSSVNIMVSNIMGKWASSTGAPETPKHAQNLTLAC